MQPVFYLATFLVLHLVIIVAHILLIQRYYQRDSLVEKLLALFVLYMGQVSIVVLYAGLLLRNLSCTVLTFSHLALSLPIIILLRKHLRESLGEFIAQGVRAARACWRSKDYFFYVMLLIFLLQLGLTLRKIYYLPPHVWDVFTTYLHPVVEWFQQNRILFEIDAPSTVVNSKALGTRLLHLWFIKFTKELTWVDLPQFLFSLTIPLSSYQLMRSLRVKTFAAARYALLIYFIPSILIQSRTCQDHLILTAALFIALVYVINIGFFNKWQQCWLLGVTLGLLIGAKLEAGPVYIVLILTAYLLTNIFRLKRIWNIVRDHKYHFIALALIVMIVGGYWYVKNYALYGRYTGPRKGMTILPRSASALDVSAAVIRPIRKFTQNWSALFARISDTGRDVYHADLPDISGFGLQFFMFGLAGYLFALVRYAAAYRKKPLLGFLLATMLLIQSMYFFLYYGPSNYRLFMHLPIMGIIFWAYLAEIAKFSRGQQYFLQSLCVGVLIFNLVATYYIESTSPEKWHNLFTSLEREQRSAISYSRWTTGAWEIIDQYLPPSEPLGFLAKDQRQAFIYPYFDNKMKRKMYYVHSLLQEQSQSVVRAVFQQNGVRFIHINHTPGKEPVSFDPEQCFPGMRCIPLLPELYVVEESLPQSTW